MRYLLSPCVRAGIVVSFSLHAELARATGQLLVLPGRERERRGVKRNSSALEGEGVVVVEWSIEKERETVRLINCREEGDARSDCRRRGLRVRRAEGYMPR